MNKTEIMEKTKAYLYDSLCGMVYRCMFAGLNDGGHAVWVNITPGEEPKTLTDYVRDEELGDMRFLVLCMDGETALPEQVAKVLGMVMDCPIDGLGADLKFAVKHMKDMGVKWVRSPLELTIRVFENTEKSKRRGKYSFWVKDRNSSCNYLADVDDFDSLDDVFSTLRTYFYVLEQTAGIPIISKDLSICEKLKKGMRKSDLAMFGHVDTKNYL